MLALQVGGMRMREIRGKEIIEYEKASAEDSYDICIAALLISRSPTSHQLCKRHRVWWPRAVTVTEDEGGIKGVIVGHVRCKINALIAVGFRDSEF